jgi:hypothetical protein
LKISDQCTTLQEYTSFVQDASPVHFDLQAALSMHYELVNRETEIKNGIREENSGICYNYLCQI